MAIAKLFAENGAKILIADIDEKAALITQKTINKLGGESSIFITDIANEKGCRDIVETTTNNYGTIDILVNNAGIGTLPDFEEEDESGWGEMLSVNAKSIWLGIKSVVSIMKSQQSGSPQEVSANLLPIMPARERSAH